MQWLVVIEQFELIYFHQGTRVDFLDNMNMLVAVFDILAVGQLMLAVQAAAKQLNYVQAYELEHQLESVAMVHVQKFQLLAVNGQSLERHLHQLDQ